MPKIGPQPIPVSYYTFFIPLENRTITPQRMVHILTATVQIIRNGFVLHFLNNERYLVPEFFSCDVPPLSGCFASFQKLLHAKTFGSKRKKAERKRNIISQIYWGSGNLFCN